MKAKLRCTGVLSFRHEFPRCCFKAFSIKCAMTGTNLDKDSACAERENPAVPGCGQLWSSVCFTALQSDWSVSQTELEMQCAKLAVDRNYAACLSFEMVSKFWKHNHLILLLGRGIFLTPIYRLLYTNAHNFLKENGK